MGTIEIVCVTCLASTEVGVGTDQEAQGTENPSSPSCLSKWCANGDHLLRGMVFVFSVLGIRYPFSLAHHPGEPQQVCEMVAEDNAAAQVSVEGRLERS